MLKIIEIQSQVDFEIIDKYSPTNCKFIEMFEVDDKYNIDSINDYIEAFSHARVENEAFVGVIKNSSNLSEYHQNKLLKTFEESADDQIHLLFIDRSDRLLETIISRGIVYKESIKFVYEDNKLHNFARKIITSSEGYKLLCEEDEIFRQLYKIEMSLNNQNIDQAILFSSQINFDKTKYKLFNNLVLNYLYEKKRNDLIREVFAIEMKTNYQVNLGLQVLSVLIIIKNNKEYYERSHWS